VGNVACQFYPHPGKKSIKLSANHDTGLVNIYTVRHGGSLTS